MFCFLLDEVKHMKGQIKEQGDAKRQYYFCNENFCCAVSAVPAGIATIVASSINEKDKGQKAGA
uniref:Uncharacterized protein n=1 Tax=Romanomermis culicivorax TaxID=13658 RepID=A0A915KUP2_ROMCU